MKQKIVKRWVLVISLLLFVAAMLLGLLFNFLFSWLGLIFVNYFSWPVYPCYFITLIALRYNKQKIALIFSIISLFFCVALIGYNMAPLYTSNELWASYVLFVAILMLSIYAFRILWQEQQTNKKRLSIIGIFMILFIAIWSYFAIFRYWPIVNFHPKYFMTIKGNVAPELIDKVKLEWMAIYSSTDKQCDKTYNYTEGTGGARSKKKVFIIHPSTSGNYQIRIPLDYYKPGFCKWKIFEINNHEIGTVAQFYPCGDSFDCEVYPISPPKHYVTKVQDSYSCSFGKGKKVSCLFNSTDGFSSNGNIPYTENYLLIENYYVKKGK